MVNSYSGWGIWAGTRLFDSRTFSVRMNTEGFGDSADLCSQVRIDWIWSDLEPERHRYWWSDLDAMVGYRKARGKQLAVWLWVAQDPGWSGQPGNRVCPDWLWREDVVSYF